MGVEDLTEGPLLERIVDRIVDLDGPPRPRAPLRLEVEGALLLGTLPDGLVRLLRDAIVLAPLLRRPPADGYPRLAALAEAHGVVLDLRLSSAGLEGQGPGIAGLAGRLFRLAVGVDLQDPFEPEVLRALLAAAGSGTDAWLELRVVTDAERAARIPALMEALRALPRGSSVTLVPAESALTARLEALRARLSEEGAAGSSRIRLPGESPHWSLRRGGPAADASALVRLALAERPELCAFSETMLRVGAGWRLSPCPAPGAPQAPLAGEGPPEGRDVVMEVRRGHRDGAPPGPCRGCTLRGRLGASLLADDQSDFLDR